MQHAPAEFHVETVTVEDVIQKHDELSGRRHRLSPQDARRAADWREAARFLRWCGENEIRRPLHFIWYRFAVLRAQRGNQRHHPSLHALQSNALLVRYKALQAQRDHEEHLKQRFESQHIRSLVGVNSGHEAVRRDYVLTNRTHLCIVQLSLSGGYHPHSRFCPACPQAAQCAAALAKQEGFDVTALRAGNLDALPAEIRNQITPIG